mmetsp:Transcript_19747/g.58559  ORF Transcript_19747/g.58559 Transcript_19747/m.58559 type:complete len:241 (-) Transcript_19747:1355-2077(-)
MNSFSACSCLARFCISLSRSASCALRCSNSANMREIITLICSSIVAGSSSGTTSLAPSLRSRFFSLARGESRRCGARCRRCGPTGRTSSSRTRGCGTCGSSTRLRCPSAASAATPTISSGPATRQTLRCCARTSLPTAPPPSTRRTTCRTSRSASCALRRAASRPATSSVCSGSRARRCGTRRRRGWRTRTRWRCPSWSPTSGRSCGSSRSTPPTAPPRSSSARPRRGSPTNTSGRWASG